MTCAGVQKEHAARKGELEVPWGALEYEMWSGGLLSVMKSRRRRGASQGLGIVSKMRWNWLRDEMDRATSSSLI